MSKAAKEAVMAKTKRPRASARKPSSPGGPGGMAALKRAQEKLKKMGIKPYKPSK